MTCDSCGREVRSIWLAYHAQLCADCYQRETSQSVWERSREKAQEHLDSLRMLDTHSSDVDPGDPYR